VKISERVEKFYNEVKVYYSEKASEYEFEVNKKELKDFQTRFEERRDFVKKTYMKPGVKNLDRHKSTAIAIIELCRANLVGDSQVKPTESDKGKVSILRYQLATHIGFELLRYWLNIELGDIGEKKIERWVRPTVYCPEGDIGYFTIFARNLYYTHERANKENMELSKYSTDYSELELAEKLYLFEYITLRENGIDPEKLKRKDKETG